MQPNLLERITKFFKNQGSASLGQRRIFLVCMAVSLIVWFFVKMTKSYDARGVLALNYRPPLGLVFAEPPLVALPFKFSGTGWDLLRMQIFRNQPSLDFNLANVPEQVITRTDISRKIEEEMQFRLLELGQDYVTIRLDSLLSKKVKIKLDTTINYGNGYYLRDKVTLTPDSVVVFGAPEILAGIQAVSTVPLEMACPEQDFRSRLKLINPRPSLLQISEAQTEMFMPVEQVTEKKLQVPILALNAKGNIRLIPPTVELTFVVGISRYKEVEAADFRVVAVFGESKGRLGSLSTVPLSLVRQPSWVYSTRISPLAVDYLIEE